MFSKKELILFDLDGTLIDSVPALALAVNHMLEQLGRTPFSEERVRTWVGNGAEVLVKRALSGKSEIDDSLERVYIAEALGIFLAYYAKNLSVSTATYPNVRETLEVLKANGYRMAIVTNKPSGFVGPIVDSLGLTGFFDSYVGGDTLPVKKPDPLPLLHACQELGVDVPRTVMVGDSKNDILAAKAAKMQSIGLTYGYNYDEDIGHYLPDLICDDISEILGAFGLETA